MNILRIYQQQTLRTRLILAFILTVFIPLVGTSLYGNWITSQVLELRAVESTQADLRLRRLQMEDTLRGVEEDLLFLSQMDSMVALRNGRFPQTLIRAQLDLADFVTTHPDVFQARYIDETGMEIIRIDAIPDGIAVVHPDALQNKINRYYFNQTMEKSMGSVFISPIDLNRELGEIQEPHTPTVRYATPVFAADGSRAGIVILNMYANPLLRHARGDTLAFVDDSGYFLTHFDPEFEWGSPTDLDNDINAQTIYPNHWQDILETEHGVILPQPANSWQAAWEFFNPLIANDDGRRVMVYETVRGGGNEWRLVEDLPRAAIFASIETFRITAVFIIIWAMILAVGIALIFSRQIAQPIQELTTDVRQFGLLHGAVLPRRPNYAVSSHYEIDELTDAFQDMSSALERQMTQLSQLNLAGHHIAARLDHEELLTAVSTATNRLFPTEYLIVSIDGDTVHEEGDDKWSIYRDDDLPNIVLKQALLDGNWSTMALDEIDRPLGFLCCAPLCIKDKLGLIEIYGSDPILGIPATGELLATLSVQISISMENAELVTRLAKRRAELQVLLEQIINAQEEERRLIAYDIHDGLIQLLVGSRLQISNFMAEYEPTPEQDNAALQKGVDGLAVAIKEARRVIEGLRPAALDDLGLVDTIRFVAEEASMEDGFVLSFTNELPPTRLSVSIETTAFRIMQEAITNARKYAKMNRLTISLCQEDNTLQIQIKDDGEGFDPAHIATPQREGVGLRSMVERARLVGGDCLIESVVGQGTAVFISLPIPQ